MNRKFVVSGGIAATVLSLSLPSPAQTAPAASAPQSQAVSPVSNPSGYWTIRYVAFISHPKTALAAGKPGFPPALGDMDQQSSVALVTTPGDFVSAFKRLQPDYDFRIVQTGTAPLRSRAASVIGADALPSDPFGMTLTDRITVRQNSPTTLDLVHKGSYAYLSVGGESGCTTTWDGENNQFSIGRTYYFGQDKRANGDITTWAFCILPGDLDQVASAWRRPLVRKSQILTARAMHQGEGLR